MAKILVADDHAPTLALLTERLMIDGFQVQGCSDADEAFECFAAERPELALVAVTLPEGADGHLARRLHQAGVKAPVLVYDGGHRNRTQGVQAILDLGAQAYVEDPTQHRTLRARIEAFLGDREPDATERVQRRAQGEARPEAMLALGLRAVRERWRGEWILEAPGVERRIRFEDGAIVSAWTSARDEGLGPWLVEQGRVTAAAWREAVDLMARDRLSTTGALVAVGAMEAGEPVLDALRAHAGELVGRQLSARQGVWRFVAGESPRGTGPRVSLDTGPLFLAAIDRLLPTRFFMSSLGKDLDRFPYRTEAFAEGIPRLGLDSKDLAFAMRIGGGVPTRALVSGERKHLARALRTIWYLAQVGLLAFSPHPRESVAAGGFSVQAVEAKRRPLPPEEVARLREDSLQIVTTSYFGCLGLDIAAGTEEVEEAYDRVARRFHPDSWSDYDLSEVEGVMQTVLDKLQAAYRVLSVEDRRKRYVAYLLSRPGAHNRRAPLNVDAEIALRRGINLSLAGDHAGALEAMGEAFSLNPLEPVIHYHLAFAKFRAARGTPAQRTREAKLMMRVALLMTSEIPGGHLVMGILEQANGNVDAARKRFLKALRLDPESRGAKEALRRLNRGP